MYLAWNKSTIHEATFKKYAVSHQSAISDAERSDGLARERVTDHKDLFNISNEKIIHTVIEYQNALVVDPSAETMQNIRGKDSTYSVMNLQNQQPCLNHFDFLF